MPEFSLTYKAFGEGALLIEWPARIDEAILEDILWLKEQLEQELKGVVECQPAYHSLTLFFSSLSHQELTDRVKRLYQNPRTVRRDQAAHWKLPVCYNPQFGIDLAAMAEKKGLTRQELVRLHTQPVYTVFFIGFLPGFLYLGGLPEALHMPRKASPRLRLPQGAVGIAGGQTGIYPQESPGGWNIIGNCPIPLFNAAQEPPCFIKAGDRLQFYSVSRAEYHALQQQLKAGMFNLKQRLHAGN